MGARCNLLPTSSQRKRGAYRCLTRVRGPWSAARDRRVVCLSRPVTVGLDSMEPYSMRPYPPGPTPSPESLTGRFTRRLGCFPTSTRHSRHMPAHIDSSWPLVRDADNQTDLVFLEPIMLEPRQYAQTPRRAVRCQICAWVGTRWYGSGILVKPCPERGSRVKCAKSWPEEVPATLDGKLMGKAA